MNISPLQGISLRFGSEERALSVRKLRSLAARLRARRPLGDLRHVYRTGPSANGDCAALKTIPGSVYVLRETTDKRLDMDGQGWSR